MALPRSLALSALAGAALMGAGLLGWQTLRAQTEVPDVAAVAAPREEAPRLFQLLYDEHFTPPLSELGQKVRIWVWLRDMDFDASQLRRLQQMAERFQERQGRLAAESERIVAEYEAQLVPQYQTLYEALRQGSPSETQLNAIAENLAVSATSSSRDQALRTLKLETLQAILNDEREFLHTLSPEQEQRLVTATFFLRHAIDPFTAPGTYREVVGSVWNAGDFTPLMRDDAVDVGHLDIGGLWGLRKDGSQNPNYSQIRRGVILFYVLKEPMMAPTIAELLASAAGEAIPERRPMGGGPPPPPPPPPPR